MCKKRLLDLWKYISFPSGFMFGILICIIITTIKLGWKCVA